MQGIYWGLVGNPLFDGKNGRRKKGKLGLK
jgi:hypothetical protein